MIDPGMQELRTAIGDVIACHLPGGDEPGVH